MTDSSLILKNLLYSTTDIYSEWYFYILEKLESSEGLDFVGNLSEIHSCKLHSNNVQFSLKFLTSEKLSNIADQFMWYRLLFPSIIIFPSDVISISYDGDKSVKIKLVQKGVDRVLIEQELLNLEKNKLELISNLDHHLRQCNFFSIRKVFESISLKDFPDVENDELWKWLNQQDKKLFWGQLVDLQIMFNSLRIIKNKSNNDSRVSLLPFEIKEIKSMIQKIR